MFDHEKLDVYRVSIEFVSWVGELLEGPLADCRHSAVNQLDRASTSAAALDVLVARRALTSDAVRPGKELLKRVVEMLSRLTLTLSGGLD